MTARGFFVAGCVLGGLAVAAGAFGAHSLREVVTADRLGVFETAVRYQMYHALALLAVAWLTHGTAVGLARIAGYLFLVGVVVFSGSLYVLVLSNVGWWGAITPLGGVALIAGWITLSIAAYRAPVFENGARPS